MDPQKLQLKNKEKSGGRKKNSINPVRTKWELSVRDSLSFNSNRRGEFDKMFES